MKIRKKVYSRDHSREEEYGAFFNKTSAGLLFLLNLAIMFLTPTLMTTSLVSKDIILMIANILLSTGYTTFFASRLFKREVSILELTLTIVAVALALALTFYLAPAIAVGGLITGLVFINHIATAVNGFFLARNLLLPPCKKLFQYMFKKCGFNVTADLFYRKALATGDDDYAIDGLLVKHCHYDILADKLLNSDKQNQIAPFNHLITILTKYVNKYTDAVFGSLTRADEIATLTKYIDEITIQGSATNALVFINKKLIRKYTKIRKLNDIKHDLIIKKEQKEKDGTIPDVKDLNKNFENISLKTIKSSTFFQRAISKIDDEITRQQEKANALKQCIPS